MLSNTVIAETPSSANKESPECASTAFQSVTRSNVVEKIYSTNCSDEKAQLYDEKSLLTDEKVQLSDEKVQPADEKPRLSDEKPELSKMPDSQISEAVVVTETESNVDVNPPESSVIIIQTAIRRFLVCFSFVVYQSRMQIPKSHQRESIVSVDVNNFILLFFMGGVSFRLGELC